MDTQLPASVLVPLSNIVLQSLDTTLNGENKLYILKA